jgi:hypothetical protein
MYEAGTAALPTNKPAQLARVPKLEEIVWTRYGSPFIGFVL